MNVIEKTPGTKIAHTNTKNSITFGDEDLSINLKNREMDEVMLIDVCSDRNQMLVIGAATGFRYVAQVEIPARKYTETAGKPDEQGKPTTIKTPVPFDINGCTLYLWGMEE
ncbi:MAG: hypothetical protein RR162_00345 [Oscillospiraceae bacterium]